MVGSKVAVSTDVVVGGNVVDGAVSPGVTGAASVVVSSVDV